MTHEPKSWWWQTSLGINRVLLGDPSEPLCSRVYRQPASRWRTAFIIAVDALFDEQDHAKRVHRRWIADDPRRARRAYA